MWSCLVLCDLHPIGGKFTGIRLASNGQQGHVRASEDKGHHDSHTQGTWVTGCIWNREGSHTVGGPEGRRRLPPDFLSLGRIFLHLSYCAPPRFHAWSSTSARSICLTCLFAVP
jgi:hypothetical protein